MYSTNRSQLFSAFAFLLATLSKQQNDLLRVKNDLLRVKKYNKCIVVDFFLLFASHAIKMRHFIYTSHVKTSRFDSRKRQKKITRSVYATRVTDWSRHVSHATQAWTRVQWTASALTYNLVAHYQQQII